MSSKICPYCKSFASLLFVSKDYNQKTNDLKFTHYRCEACNLIFIDPVPADLGVYYPNSYHFIPDSRDYLKTGSMPERYKIEMILNHVQSGRLLEIGPSYGSFTYLAKEAGFEVSAIEMNERCCDFLRNVVEVDVIQSDDPVAALEEVSLFDVIALWHVIEHLPSPFATLDSIYAKLKPGGCLVVAAPNPDAFQFGLMRQFWPHLDAPRHVMLIPTSVIREKMESLGMKLELATTADPGGLGWNVFGWEFLLSNLSNNILAKKVLRRIGRVISFVLSPIERRDGAGSAYTMIFRKGEPN